MRVRKATKRDFREIVNLRKKFYLEECCAFDEFLNPKWADKGLPISTALALRRKNAILLVAEEKNKIIGYLVGEIKKQPKFIRYSKKGEIDNVYVRKEHRGKDIGTTLIKGAINWFREKGVSWNYLIVYPNNPAYKLYKKLGFKEWFIEMNYLKC